MVPTAHFGEYDVKYLLHYAPIDANMRGRGDDRGTSSAILTAPHHSPLRMTSARLTNQPPLPHFPSASTKHGMWYVFHDGPNTIRAWGSHWLGLERVYFNDKLLEHWTHLKRRDHYSFNVGGNEYHIQCVNSSENRWQVECLLWRNDEKIDGWVCRRKKLLDIAPTIAYLYAGIFTGMLGGLFNMPVWYGLFFIFLVMIITLVATAKTDRFVFERLHPDMTRVRPMPF